LRELTHTRQFNGNEQKYKGEEQLPYMKEGPPSMKFLSSLNM